MNISEFHQQEDMPCKSTKLTEMTYGHIFDFYDGCNSLQVLIQIYQWLTRKPVYHQ